MPEALGDRRHDPFLQGGLRRLSASASAFSWTGVDFEKDEADPQHRAGHVEEPQQERQEPERVHLAKAIHSTSTRPAMASPTRSDLPAR